MTLRQKICESGAANLREYLCTTQAGGSSGVEIPVSIETTEIPIIISEVEPIEIVLEVAEVKIVVSDFEIGIDITPEEIKTIIKDC